MIELQTKGGELLLDLSQSLSAELPVLCQLKLGLQTELIEDADLGPLESIAWASTQAKNADRLLCNLLQRLTVQNGQASAPPGLKDLNLRNDRVVFLQKGIDEILCCIQPSHTVGDWHQFDFHDL